MIIDIDKRVAYKSRSAGYHQESGLEIQIYRYRRQSGQLSLGIRSRENWTRYAVHLSHLS